MIKRPLGKRRISLILIILILIIEIFMGVFLFLKKEEFSSFDVSFSISNVTIENKLPVSDALGKTLSVSSSPEGVSDYISFSIDNNNNKKEKKYAILLTKKDKKEDEILERYIKLYLTDDNDLAYPGFDKDFVPTYNNFMVSKDRPNSRILYEGKIKPFSKKEFRLRVWLSDGYLIKEEKEEFSFEVEVF